MQYLIGMKTTEFKTTYTEVNMAHLCPEKLVMITVSISLASSNQHRKNKTVGCETNFVETCDLKLQSYFNKHIETEKSPKFKNSKKIRIF